MFNQRVEMTGADLPLVTLLVNGHLIMPSGFPDTRNKLQALGKPIIELDTSEFRKMDGGLTCLSLRF